MTLARVNPAGWLSGNKITQAQINQLDTNVASAVDKAGDTVPGALILNGTLRCNATATMNADCIFLSTRQCNFQSGAQQYFLAGSNSTFQAGSTCTFNAAAGATPAAILQVDGTLAGNTSLTGAKTITAGSLTAASGTAIQVPTGAALDVNGNFTGDTQLAGNKNIASGILAVGSGAAVNFNPAASLVLPAQDQTTFATAYFQRVVRGAPFFLDGFGWTASAGGVYRLTQTSSAYFGVVGFRLNLPKGATITLVNVYLKGASGHGAMPATKPSAAVVWGSATDDTGTPGTNVTDSQTTVGAYESAHVIGISGADLPSGLNPHAPEFNHYEIYLAGETGANAIVGLKFTGILVFFTLASIDYAPTT